MTPLLYTDMIFLYNMEFGSFKYATEVQNEVTIRNASYYQTSDTKHCLFSNLIQNIIFKRNKKKEGKEKTAFQKAQQVNYY